MSKSSSSSFSQWMSDQEKNNDPNNKSSSDTNSSSSYYISNVFGQISSIQDNVTSQFQDLSNSLPDGGPLSSAFRARVIQAVYLIIAAVGFIILAIFIGLPTLVLKPAKFVFCITAATVLAASSVIVLQKPLEFIKSIINGGYQQSLPIILLFLSVLFTLYTTIIVHKYLYILFAGILQLLAMFYYLSSFIPGGQKGLELLLKSAFIVLKTLLSPFIFIARKTIISFCKQVFS